MSEQPAGEIILYHRGDATAIDVLLDGDTVRLTQEQMVGRAAERGGSGLSGNREDGTEESCQEEKP